MKTLYYNLLNIAGSGKSYAIEVLRNLSPTNCQVFIYTEKAACNVNGITLHSLLRLPIGTKRLNDLKRTALLQLQSYLENVKYLIIDEYSFVGQGLFGWIDSRCRQATAKTNIPFGDNSVLLFGDIAQLPPV